jgi:signal transduction histidine kinase
MRSVLRSEVWRSLRFRLSVWNTAVVAVAVLIALLALREALRFTLVREADQLLREDLVELSLAVREFHPNLRQIHDEMNRKAQGHEHRHLFIQLIEPGGKDVWSSVNTPLALKQRLGVLAYFTPRTLDGYRVAERQIQYPELPRYTIRVGTSLAYIAQDVAKVSQLMMLVGTALLIASPIGGYLLAGRATKPLGEIIKTARSLRPFKLHERLPLRHTGDELDQLSATINGLLDRIAAYLERNRQFTANAAHELRSPLAAIRSAVEVALAAPREPEQYQELLCEIVEQISDLGVLVNQLLLLAESESRDRHWRRDPVPLDQLATRATDMFEGVAEERGITLRIGRLFPVTIPGDPWRLKQVFNNLIDNALKFTQPGGTVQVDVDRDDQFARLRVTDTGIGIAPSDLPHIFEQFFLVDRARAREGLRGNGLGLPICQAIVEAHGGRINVHSEPGQGSEFIVYLPMQSNGDE